MSSTKLSKEDKLRLVLISCMCMELEKKDREMLTANLEYE